MRLLASPRLTVTFFLLTAAGALVAKEGILEPTAAMLLPFGLLVTNLLAAILIHPRFRSDLPLLIFHLALLALLALFALGRMIYLHGSIAVTQDTPFNGVFSRLDVGPLHPPVYRQLKFEHAALVERFNDAGGLHTDLRSRLRWLDERLGWQEIELRVGYPAILSGYRIYPSKHRGYTPIFLWQGRDGHEDLGAVQLLGPSESAMENTNDWILPSGQPAWLQLINLAPGPQPAGTMRLNLGAGQLPHKLILRVGDARHEIRLGDTINLEGGVLRYVKLKSWAGYSLIYDPTEPWLIAAILIAIAAMAWYYLRRFKSRIMEGIPS